MFENLQVGLVLIGNTTFFCIPWIAVNKQLPPFLLAAIDAATTLVLNAKTLEIRWKRDVSLLSCHPLRRDVHMP